MRTTPAALTLAAALTFALAAHCRARAPIAPSPPLPSAPNVDDDDLRIYAVNVVKKAPLKAQFTGFGIYLGAGKVLTAAHVVGNYPSITQPHVLVAGLDLPAEIVKQGSVETTDLAILSIDETQLPVSLRLRRNPVCKAQPLQRTPVVVVYPERTVRTQVISPLLIAPKYRARLPTLIAEEEGSGAGVFQADRHCLLGIISQKVAKFIYGQFGGHVVAKPNGFAGYYVGVAAIRAFIPAELHDLVN